MEIIPSLVAIEHENRSLMRQSVWLEMHLPCRREQIKANQPTLLGVGFKAQVQFYQPGIELHGAQHKIH
jgi:hypothetical protein